MGEKKNLKKRKKLICSSFAGSYPRFFKKGKFWFRIYKNPGNYWDYPRSDSIRGFLILLFNKVKIVKNADKACLGLKR